MKRNSLIDIIKGFCIMFIILDHYTNWGNLRDYLLFPYWITMAVPVLMLISGYLYAQSFIKHNISSLSVAYHPAFIIRHWLRFLVPFFIVYCAELIISSLSNDFSAVIRKWICDLPLGGWGPGAYYTPIMLQFVLFFPIIYFLIRKYDSIGLILCALFNILFEFIQWAIQMNGILYKTLLFRYVLLIAFGCYFSIGKKKLSRSISIGMILIGGVYIFAYNYLDYQPIILSKWTGTNFVSVLFVIPIFAALIQNVKIKETHNHLLELIGRASYNIYLVQMVYFNYIANKLYAHFDIIPISNIINLCICVSLGILFYFLERKLIRYNLIDTIFSNRRN